MIRLVSLPAIVCMSIAACILMLARPAASLEGMALNNAIGQIPAEKMEKSHKKFHFFDTDGSHYIDRSEFEKGLKKMGYKVNDKKIATIMSKLDHNDDGKVTFREFLRPSAVKHHKPGGKSTSALGKLDEFAFTDKMMEVLDLDGDGLVSVDEILLAMRKGNHAGRLNRKMVEGFFQDFADEDGDSHLSYEEVQAVDWA